MKVPLKRKSKDVLHSHRRVVERMRKSDIANVADPTGATSGDHAYFLAASNATSQPFIHGDHVWTPPDWASPFGTGASLAGASLIVDQAGLYGISWRGVAEADSNAIAPQISGPAAPLFGGAPALAGGRIYYEVSGFVYVEESGALNFFFNDPDDAVSSITDVFQFVSVVFVTG